MAKQKTKELVEEQVSTDDKKKKPKAGKKEDSAKKTPSKKPTTKKAPKKESLNEKDSVKTEPSTPTTKKTPKKESRNEKETIKTKPNTKRKTKPAKVEQEAVAEPADIGVVTEENVVKAVATGVVTEVVKQANAADVAQDAEAIEAMASIDENASFDPNTAIAAKKKRGRKPMTDTQKEEAAKLRAELKIAEKNMRPEIVLQYKDDETNIDMLVEKVKAAFKETHKRTIITMLRLYLKPEEKAVYYVVNDKDSGKIEI